VHTIQYRRKVEAVFLFFLLFLLICVARLLYIQFFRSQYLAEIAKKQQNVCLELEPRRGNIYDVNLRPQAVNLAVDSIYASAQDASFEEKERIIPKLSSILGLSQEFLRERLSRKKSFVWVARKISAEQSQAIKQLKVKWLGFIKESKRCYPNLYLASHIIGYSGLDNIGLDGLELYYDKYLKGQAGWALIQRDARQKKLDLSEKMVAPFDGYDIVLTIDEVIQYIAERELDKVFKAFHAKGASIIVMNPNTGEVLALANRPSFDLNEYPYADKESRRDRALTDMFEPGSIFKIVTACAALESKEVSEQDKFFCENGAYRVANHILHDHTSHGWLTFSKVIQESSNIGTTKIAQMLGPEMVYRYARLFGFASRLDVDLPGEISGSLKNPRAWSKTSISAVPIGQEVGVTVLQLASYISVVANGGLLMKPFVVKEIRDKRGETIKAFAPTMIHKAISADTAARMKKILVGVVDEGTGRLARIPGVAVAGKTGTAQKLEPNGSYSHSKFIASFIGFAPADDPLIAVVVSVDEPHPLYFGGVVSAPVFKNVVSDVLRYLKTNRSIEDIIALHETHNVN
jgi:cell division protein FtsI/penicillin-binding protein 2